MTQQEKQEIDLIKLKSILDTGSTEHWEQCLNWPSSANHPDGVFYNITEKQEYNHSHENSNSNQQPT